MDLQLWMGEELILELNQELELGGTRATSQPEQERKLQGRKWVPDEQEAGRSVAEGPELHSEVIGTVRWERVLDELGANQPAVPGPELKVVVPSHFVLTLLGSVGTSFGGLQWEPVLQTCEHHSVGLEPAAMVQASGYVGRPARLPGGIQMSGGSDCLPHELDPEHSPPDRGHVFARWSWGWLG